MVNRPLPRERREPRGSSGQPGGDARREYVSKDDHFGRDVAGGPRSFRNPSDCGRASCSTALNEFREIVRTETSMGHVTQTNQTGASVEIARIEGLCRSGLNTEALAALQALQRRMGFR
jgi:hypothetical protein